MPASIYIRGGVAAAGGGQQSQTCAPAAADPGAIISCNCEKVKLKFTVAQPRMRLECCCVDCNDAYKWAESKGGPKDSGMGRGADLWYFENDLAVVSGNEHIAFRVLSDGYPTTRLVATCCYSTLCGDHPGYMGNVAVVYGDSLRSGNFMPQQVRINADDLSAEDQALLAPKEFPKGTINPGRGEEEMAALIEAVGGPFGTPPSTTSAFARGLLLVDCANVS